MTLSRMRGYRRSILFAVVSVLACSGRALAMTLVQEGQARAVIILSEKPSPAAREGALVLQEHVLQISGAKLPITSENEISGGSSSLRGWVLVGESRLAEGLGFSAKDLGPGGSRPPRPIPAGTRNRRIFRFPM